MDDTLSVITYRYAYSWLTHTRARAYGHTNRQRFYRLGPYILAQQTEQMYMQFSRIRHQEITDRFPVEFRRSPLPRFCRSCSTAAAATHTIQ